MPKAKATMKRTIVEIRRMTATEMRAERWTPGLQDTPLVLVLDDGTRLYPAADPEGNGPGCLFGISPAGEHIRLA